MVEAELHWVEFVASILVLEWVVDHMKYVSTCCVVGGVLLAYDGVLTAAKIVPLHVTNKSGAERQKEKKTC